VLERRAEVADLRRQPEVLEEARAGRGGGHRYGPGCTCR
jgi:hypothetical protein